MPLKPPAGASGPDGVVFAEWPAGHRENRSESSVGSRPKWCVAEAVITGTDKTNNTGDEFPGGSRNVVNPHTWPVCTKIAKNSGGQGESTEEGAIGLEHQPTQANAGDRRGGGE